MKENIDPRRKGVPVHRRAFEEVGIIGITHYNLRTSPNTFPQTPRHQMTFTYHPLSTPKQGPNSSHRGSSSPQMHFAWHYRDCPMRFESVGRLGPPRATYTVTHTGKHRSPCQLGFDVRLVAHTFQMAIVIISFLDRPSAER
jgi:hypothetical protein